MASKEHKNCLVDTHTQKNCQSPNRISDTTSDECDELVLLDTGLHYSRAASAGADLTLTAYSRGQQPLKVTSSNPEVIIIKIDAKLQSNGIMKAEKVSIEGKVFSVLLVSENEQAKEKSILQEIVSDDSLSVSASSSTTSDDDDDDEDGNEAVDPSLYQGSSSKRESSKPTILQAISNNPELMSIMAKKKKGFYVCSHCPTKFASMLDFAEHMEENNITRSFRCADMSCPWHFLGFEKRGHWRRHQRTQHGTSLSCPHDSCEKAFSRTDSLARHIRRCHLNKKMRKRNSRASSSTSAEHPNLESFNIDDMIHDEMMNSENEFAIDHETAQEVTMTPVAKSDDFQAEISVIDPDVLVATALAH